MTEMKWLQQMCEVVRADCPPAIDVAPAVMCRLQRGDRGVVGPLAVMAALSAVAAVVVATFALDAWSELQDPFSVLLDSVNLVLQ